MRRLTGYTPGRSQTGSDLVGREAVDPHRSASWQLGEAECPPGFPCYRAHLEQKIYEIIIIRLIKNEIITTSYHNSNN